MAREVIALMLNVSEDSFDITVEPDLDSLGGVREAIEAAIRERERANAAQDAAMHGTEAAYQAAVSALTGNCRRA